MSFLDNLMVDATVVCQAKPVPPLTKEAAAGMVPYYLTRLILDTAPVGSAYTGGASASSDIDVLVLVTSKAEASGVLHAHAAETGAVQGGSELPGDPDEWESWRDGALNLLITDCPKFFSRFVAAAEACRYLRVEDKTTRKVLHKIITDGTTADDARAAFG